MSLLNLKSQESEFNLNQLLNLLEYVSLAKFKLNESDIYSKQSDPIQSMSLPKFEIIYDIFLYMIFLIHHNSRVHQLSNRIIESLESETKFQSFFIFERILF